MADTDTITVPETTPAEPLPPASSPSAPAEPDNTEQQAEAKALQEQLQKLEMERNMLRKQKDALEKAKADQERKELEEKEDYRSLAERAQAELEAIRKEKADMEAKDARDKATADVFANFDPKVVDMAKTAGLVVDGDSEEAKSALTTKLESIREKLGVSTSPTPTHNNPAPTVPTEETPQYQRVEDLKLDSKDAAVYRNSRAAQKHLKDLEALKQMRKISGREPQEINL